MSLINKFNVIKLFQLLTLRQELLGTKFIFNCSAAERKITQVPMDSWRVEGGECELPMCGSKVKFVISVRLLVCALWNLKMLTFGSRKNINT